MRIQINFTDGSVRVIDSPTASILTQPAVAVVSEEPGVQDIYPYHTIEVIRVGIPFGTPAVEPETTEPAPE